MIPYVAMVVLLTALSLLEGTQVRASLVQGRISAIAIALFVGLRFETGSDWPEYELLYDYTSSFFAAIPQHYDPNLTVEPGFAFFMSLLRTIDAPFQILLTSVAFFSIAVLWYFARLYTSRPSLVMLWYFGFATLVGQMAAIRQVFAYSFVLIAFILLDRRHRAASLASVGVAASMHVFSVVFAIPLYLRIKPPKTTIVLAAIVPGLILSVLGYPIFTMLADALLPSLSGLLGYKVGNYRAAGAYGISPLSILLFVYHCGVLKLLNQRDVPRHEDSVVRFAIYCTILSLIAHAYFATFPAFWNRLMLLTMAVQATALTRTYAEWVRNPERTVALTLGAGAIVAVSLVYPLSTENGLPYVPYQFLGEAELTGNPGDGRFRYAYFIARQQRDLKQQEIP
jgi:hypothetical protein